jgi:hypothetical protein
MTTSLQPNVLDGRAPHESDANDRARDMAEAIRGGTCPRDADFDQLYPEELRAVSGVFWTPLRVALRAVDWLRELHVKSLVDIGSGAGKLCVTVALASECQVIGVEQRLRLVAASRELASQLGAARASFVESTLGTDPLPVADAYYVFNPFGENRFLGEERLDSEVELTDERFARDVESFELFLRDAPIGTYLITYNGFGGRVPSCYRQVRVDRDMPCVLRMWRKTMHDRGDWRSPEAFLSMLDERAQRWHDDDEGDEHSE